LPIGKGASITFSDGSTAVVQGGHIISIERVDASARLGSGIRAIWSNPFTDVHEGAWYYTDVEFAYSSGLMQGSSQSAFSPNDPMTRGMLATVLGRLAGVDASGYASSSFIDVPAGQHFSPFIQWAKEIGLVAGIGGDMFAPDIAISRQDLSAILVRYANYAGYRLPYAIAPPFADGEKIAEYAKDSVQTLAASGIVKGRPGNIFDPESSASRSEIAAIIRRFAEAAQQQ
jgi:hypothetical protein